MKTGDVVAKVAKPIAKTLDSIWGTNLQNCGACKQTQNDLNNATTIWDFVDAVKHRLNQPPTNQKE